jgi:hypothetical protein
MFDNNSVIANFIPLTDCFDDNKMEEQKRDKI